jgi:hypothetical protein
VAVLGLLVTGVVLARRRRPEPVDIELDLAALDRLCVTC